MRGIKNKHKKKTVKEEEEGGGGKRDQQKPPPTDTHVKKELTLGLPDVERRKKGPTKGGLIESKMGVTKKWGSKRDQFLGGSRGIPKYAWGGAKKRVPP